MLAFTSEFFPVLNFCLVISIPSGRVGGGDLLLQLKLALEITFIHNYCLMSSGSPHPSLAKPLLQGLLISLFVILQFSKHGNLAFGQ
jgi:hypothetical protein